MAAWLYEEGIGENRAALVDDGAIVEALIELPHEIRIGSVVDARLKEILIPARRAVVALSNHCEALIEPAPSAVPLGGTVRVEVVREPVAEAGREKRAKVRVTAEPLGQGPSLRERLDSTRAPPRFGPDLLEQAGWSELLEEAATGEIGFEGGALRMSLTPAMTLFDVDGWLPTEELAIAGAAAAARAIRRFGIGGSIGIDLPTVAGKAARAAVADAVDAILPQPFERTAVNGFGFLQIVRRRERASIPELLRSDPAGAAARALLRQAERLGGDLVLTAAPPVVARLEAEGGWLSALEGRCGGRVGLRADAGLPIYGGHVHQNIV